MVVSILDDSKTLHGKSQAVCKLMITVFLATCTGTALGGEVWNQATSNPTTRACPLNLRIYTHNPPLVYVLWAMNQKKTNLSPFYPIRWVALRQVPGWYEKATKEPNQCLLWNLHHGYRRGQVTILVGVTTGWTDGFFMGKLWGPNWRFLSPQISGLARESVANGFEMLSQQAMETFAEVFGGSKGRLQKGCFGCCFWLFSNMCLNKTTWNRFDVWSSKSQSLPPTWKKQR